MSLTLRCLSSPLFVSSSAMRHDDEDGESTAIDVSAAARINLLGTPPEFQFGTRPLYFRWRWKIRVSFFESTFNVLFSFFRLAKAE